MTTTIGRIIITALHDGAALRFPKDAKLIASLKQTFPKARWGASTGSWHVPGKLAERRAIAWAEAREAEHRAAEAAREQARRDAEFEGRPIPIETLEGKDYLDALHAQGRRVTTKLIRLARTGDRLTVSFAYAAEAVRLIKEVPGARYAPEGRTWSVPLASVRALHAVIADMDAAVAAQTAAEVALRQERRDGWAAERAERETRMRRLRDNRYLCRDDDRPGIGETVRHGTATVVVESVGKAFYLDGGDADGLHGPHLWDTHVAYVYYRSATPDEVRAIEAREADAACRAGAVRDAKAALRRLHAEVDADGERPARLESWPAGVVVAEEDRGLSIYGGGVTWLLAGADLWRIRGNGADGDDWSLNNLPGAIATRIAATPDRVRVLEGASDVLAAPAAPEHARGSAVDDLVQIPLGTVLAQGEITTVSGRVVPIEVSFTGTDRSVAAWATILDGQSLVERTGPVVASLGLASDLAAELVRRGAAHWLGCPDVVRGGGRRPGGWAVLGLSGEMWDRYQALRTEGARRLEALIVEIRAAREAARAEAIDRIMVSAA